MSGLWAVVLTAVFCVSGAYCLWRWASRLAIHRSDREPAESLVDVNHVVMSVAMVVMVWWPTSPAGRALQIAIFAGLGLIFLVKLIGAESTAARRTALGHVVMDAAMVWMLAAMPALMAGMPAHGPTMDMPGMSMGTGDPMSAVTVGVPSWAKSLNWTVVGVLALTAGWWAVRAVRSAGHRMHCSCHGLMCAGMGLMLVAMQPGI